MASETTGEVSAPELSADEKFNAMLAALTQIAQQKSSGMDMDALEALLAKTATISAQTMQKAMKPENATHPGISCFSYPEGDAARPKPKLPFEFNYNGYPFSKFPETQDTRELELACQVTPGVYTVVCKDGTPMKVTVEGERDAHGTITKLDVKFAVPRDRKEHIPPQSVVLYQLVHNEDPQAAFVESMNDYLQRVFLRRKTAAV